MRNRWSAWRNGSGNRASVGQLANQVTALEPFPSARREKDRRGGGGCTKRIWRPVLSAGFIPILISKPRELDKSLDRPYLFSLSTNEMTIIKTPCVAAVNEERQRGEPSLRLSAAAPVVALRVGFLSLASVFTFNSWRRSVQWHRPFRSYCNPVFPFFLF